MASKWWRPRAETKQSISLATSALSTAENLGAVTFALAELEGAKILHRAGHPAAQKLYHRACQSLARVNLPLSWAMATVSLASRSPARELGSLKRALKVLLAGPSTRDDRATRRPHSATSQYRADPCRRHRVRHESLIPGNLIDFGKRVLAVDLREGYSMNISRIFRRGVILRRRSIRILGVSLVIAMTAGCGSSRGEFVSVTTPQVSNSRVIVSQPLGARSRPDITSFEVSLRDVSGSLVEAPRIFPSTSGIELRVPPATAVLEIDYLSENDSVEGTFATVIDPDLNPNITIDSPAWVDSEGVDPTVSRFALTCCNRLGCGELTDDNPSSANRAQLLADLSEIPTVDPPASHFFFAGDLVTNLDPGTDTLRSQLTAWLELFRSTPLAASSVQLVPFTGNHEVLLSRKDPVTDKFVEFPNPATLPVWTSLMGPYLRGSNGPTTAAPNPDNLTDDQSRLSYTFQSGDVFFVVLNTDTFIDDTTLGDVPLNWLSDRLDEGQSDPSVRHIFVMGHKPIVAPPGGDEPPGPGSIRAEEKSPFAGLLAGHAKVRGYLCAHAHTWDYRNLEAGTPQLIAGNAGSQVDPGFNDTGRGYYGYTLLSIHASGTVHLESWGRPIPNPYNAAVIQSATSLREKRLLN